MKKYCILMLSIAFLLSNLLVQPKAQTKDTPKSLNEGLNDLSEQISKDLTENQKKRIAVVEFADLKGNVTDFGRYISEKLITKLFETKKFRVVERQLLNKIIAEQKLSLTGIIDATTAQKLGKLLGVDAITAGSISDLTKSMEINARLISTETGEVFSAASVQILKDETVCNLIGGCNQVTNSSPTPTVKPTPVKPKSWIIESNFFTFELHRCRRSGTSVICEFTITNNDKDRNLEIDADSSSKLYDEYNNESLASGAEMANKQKSYYPKSFLVNGIATRARVYFENFSSSSNKITRMDIRLCPQGSECFYIQYRNITIGDSQSQNFDDTIRQERIDSNTESKTGEVRSIAVKDDVYMQFVWIPPGEFMIGSPTGDKDAGKDEMPQKLVKISKGFWIGKYEVTLKQWKAIMGYTPTCSYGNCGENTPVEVSLWEHAQEFIAKLNKTDSDAKFRLPSEAEWEYAARAGTTTRYYWGDDSGNSLICRYANVFDLTFIEKRYANKETLFLKPARCYDKYENPAPVGSFLPNAWNLYDMIGNVAEWCEDDYAKSYQDTPSDEKPYKSTKKSDEHIIRGGWFSAYANKNRIANRSKGSATQYVGMRLVAETL